MPTWDFHLHVAHQVLKKVAVKEPCSFMLGSTLPDTPWMSLTDSTFDRFRDRLHVYHTISNKFCNVPDVQTWLHENEERVRTSDTYAGVLTHVVLDSILNEMWNAAVKMDGEGCYKISIGGDVVATTHGILAKLKADSGFAYSYSHFTSIGKIVDSYLDKPKTDFEKVMRETFYEYGDNIDRYIKNIRSVCYNDKSKYTDCGVIKSSDYAAMISEAINRSVRLITMIRSQ